MIVSTLRESDSKHMNFPFSRAPHTDGVSHVPQSGNSPNAALLIDFDNVTMGIRSDLSKELKALLGSDVIRGKVTVQRAYADWRRYPQYIVPLSKSSIDLIFAPAYGTNKKNATDIRMAIDGMELVFTRPEIGTFILLTGDSDFSSLVLKLKEYGKYVIGVGMQESSSDILVQNCDEYYSYTSLSGLTKADEGAGATVDPWKLVGQALEQMARRGDVMRSDRLKQVMIELDSSFDEKGIGFNKFSKFMAEASAKGIVEIQRMKNGQYEILSPARGKRAEGPKRGRGTRDEKRPQPPQPPLCATPPEAQAKQPEDAPPAPPAGADGGSAPDVTLDAAYDLLREATGALLLESEADSARDSIVKRRMLARGRGFSEGKLGFSKFSKFLQRAEADGVIQLRKGKDGILRIALDQIAPDQIAPDQIAPVSTTPTVGLELIGLPSGRGPIVKYLSNSYGGVGKRTAETLVDALGDELFHVLEANPSRVAEILPPARAERVMAGWRADYQRRIERSAEVEVRQEPAEVRQELEVTAAASDAEASEAPEAPKSRAMRGRRVRRGSDPAG